MSPVALLLLGLGGLLILFGFALATLRGRRHRDGTLRVVDLPGRPAPLLRSERWRLAGRPDELRESREGLWIPVELKGRAAPARAVPDSHRAQLAAYCLLVEEVTGLSPPYGVLRYGDGRELRLAWDAGTRAWLWSLRRALDAPYHGEDRASPARCARCGWREVCDRRAL